MMIYGNKKEKYLQLVVSDAVGGVGVEELEGLLDLLELVLAEGEEARLRFGVGGWLARG